ncbi:ABC transporter permease [Brevibacillus sp. MCWH]|jgi:ABC-type transport system involved in multi-copper enzyme maturation permease subunit|uniref:ABC transporter permease n=1 Tax=Brevibacillus sp. MCWH TaxID=2508871 RepID=UPI00149250A2|nr:ABC transporter permease [Brevibacillus sp. MCWH]NNV03327.1 ABC transporter permease [Brevibacillus sp. MCWH]
MNLMQRLRNPVLVNEWKLRMRTRRSPWIIAFYLLALGMVTLTFIYLVTGGRGYYNMNNSREMFIVLSILQLGMICFVVPGLTAGVISGERERQTLNVLLTTNISATKLILGKWLASLSFVTFLVFSTIPLYAIVFLYGGISPAQLLKVFGFYLVTMLALGSVGVLISTLIKRTGVATVLSYAVVFAYTAGTVILAEVIREFIEYQQRQNPAPVRTEPLLPDLLHSINPLVGMLGIFNEGPVHDLRRTLSSQFSFVSVDPFWLYVLFLTFVTAICLALAVYLIKPVRPRLRKAANKE